MSIKKLCLILIVSVFMISMFVATASAVDVPINEKKDGGIVIDSKSKTANYKIIWNANGGKIGDKNSVSTFVKKSSKINKLATTPKKSTYKFLGWYTKKNGGKKISVNTIPKKSVTYYGQWKLKVIGTWKDNSNSFVFKKNGKFSYTQISGSKSTVTEGNYKVSVKTIAFTNIVTNPGKANEQGRNNTEFEYKFVKDDAGEYIMIPTVFTDLSYVTLDYGVGLRK